MAQCIVQVTVVSRVLTHPNADLLDIAEVLGWQVVVKKGSMVAGDKIVYFPPDTCIPTSLSDEFNITKYLKSSGIENYHRIGKVKLRGEPSYGLAIPAPSDLSVGDIVTDLYQAIKYEPPVRYVVSDADVPNALFEKYTDIENLRNYPDVFVDGEEVIISEKINGTNSRVGYVAGELMIGTKSIRRKVPNIEEYATGTYSYPLSLPEVNALLDELKMSNNIVILFGEIYGSKIVGGFNYGQNRLVGYRVFDIYRSNGVGDSGYLDYDDFCHLCSKYGIEQAPILYRGEYDIDVVKSLSNGRTTFDKAHHIREGVVVKPSINRYDPRVGRVIMKYLGDDYLLGGYTDYTDE